MDRDYSKLNIILLGNGQEWLTYCWKEALEKYQNIHLFNSFLPDLGSNILNKLCRFLFSKKASNLPFKRLFYRHIIKAIGLTKKTPAQIVFYDYGTLSRDLSFVKFIKKEYPDVFLIYRFTNIVSISRAKIAGYLPQLNGLFNMVLTYDKIDEREYKFHYQPLVYSVRLKNEPETKYDLFFVGNAKDRLDTLLEIYEKATFERLKCLFYIMNADPSRQKFGDAIHYDERIDYSIVLDCISKSKALVDVIQGNSSGFTLKTCEAICLNKKLITTNTAMLEMPFCNEANVLIYNRNKSLSKFLNKPSFPFTDTDKYYFSAEHFLDCVKEECES